MRTTTLFALACLTTSQALFAQVYTTPAGYTTQTLKANQYNLVGLTLHGDPLASGSIDAVTNTVLTDNQAAFSVVAGRSYILEITNDANAGVSLEGTIQLVPAASITATTVTTTDDLPSFGLQVGATYTLRLAPTIEEIFGTTTSIISKGPNGASPLSDVIWVPLSNGVYTRYYIRSSDNTVRNALTNVATLNTPIAYTDGLIVEKKNTGDASLVLSGSIKTTVARLALETGYNLIGTAYPAGSTLQNCGLASAISAGPNSASPLSDVVWIPNGAGGYTTYYLRSSDSTWRNAVTNILAPTDLSLTTSVLLQRKSASPVNVTITAPSAYATAN